jgi:alkylated DNA repair dioxygenase AlkB
LDYAALGLTLNLAFITPEEEAALIPHVKAAAPDKQRKVPVRNSIRRYGSREPYFDNLVSEVIPEYFFRLCRRLFEHKLVDALPDSVTVNEYYAGQTITPHIDHVDAGPVITILSLASPATMRFSLSGQNFDVELPARSLVQMRNQIRYNWQHEILPVPDLRYSLVFRDSASCLRARQPKI